MLLLLTGILNANQRNVSLAANRSGISNSWELSSFILYHTEDVGKHPSTRARVVLDQVGNAHTVQIGKINGDQLALFHFRTDFSSKQVHSNLISPWSGFTNNELRLFANQDSGGVDFLFWDYNDSLQALEFFQFSSNPHSDSNIVQIAEISAEALDRYDFDVAWNGTHPFLFYCQPQYNASSNDLQFANISVLWPGETNLTVSGKIPDEHFSSIGVDRFGALMLWMVAYVGAYDDYDKRVIGYQVMSGQVRCVADFILRATRRVLICPSEDGSFWLLTYGFEREPNNLQLQQLILDSLTGNYSRIPKYQHSKDIVASNNNLRLGVRNGVPFLVYLDWSIEHVSALLAPFLGYWTIKGEFRSMPLDTIHQGAEYQFTLSDPLGNAEGIVVPYRKHQIQQQSDFQDHGLDPDQGMDGVFLASNISTLQGITPAIINLKEIQTDPFPFDLSQITMIILIVAGSGSSLGYLWYRRRKSAIKLIERLDYQ